jgi:hypothetical protein
LELNGSYNRTGRNSFPGQPAVAGRIKLFPVADKDMFHIRDAPDNLAIRSRQWQRRGLCPSLAAVIRIDGLGGRFDHSLRKSSPLVPRGYARPPLDRSLRLPDGLAGRFRKQAAIVRLEKRCFQFFLWQGAALMIPTADSYACFRRLIRLQA